MQYKCTYKVKRCVSGIQYLLRVEGHIHSYSFPTYYKHDSTLVIHRSILFLSLLLSYYPYTLTRAHIIYTCTVWTYYDI